MPARDVGEQEKRHLTIENFGTRGPRGEYGLDAGVEDSYVAFRRRYGAPSKSGCRRSSRSRKELPEALSPSGPTALSPAGLTADGRDRDVPHRRIGLGAMPMAFTGLDVHDVARMTLLHGSAGWTQ